MIPKWALYSAVFTITTIGGWVVISSGDDRPRFTVETPEPKDETYHAPVDFSEFEDIEELSKEEFNSFKEAYRKARKEGRGDENLFTFQQKLRLLSSSAKFEPAAQVKLPAGLASNLWQPSAYALDDEELYKKERSEHNQKRQEFVLKEATRQFQVVSETINEAKAEGSKTPEELKEAEEALAKLEEAKNAMAAAKDDDYWSSQSGAEEGSEGDGPAIVPGE